MMTNVTFRASKGQESKSMFIELTDEPSPDLMEVLLDLACRRLFSAKTAEDVEYTSASLLAELETKGTRTVDDIFKVAVQQYKSTASWKQKEASLSDDEKRNYTAFAFASRYASGEEGMVSFVDGIKAQLEGVSL